jgi:hypothetical protein
MKVLLALLMMILLLAGCSHKRHKPPTDSAQNYPRENGVKYKALIVGLNDYAGEGADLFGIDLDVAKMQNLLQNWGFEITLLQEAASTQFEAQMQHYADTLNSDDVLVIYFSGHGSHTPDHSGDEADGRDESIVLSDGTHNIFYIDDKIEPLLKKIKARKLYIVDACYSGTVYKAHRSANSNIRSKYLPAPPGIGDQNVTSVTYKLLSTQTGPLVTLSACRDDEESLASTEGSLFTNALVSHIALHKSFTALHQETVSALNDRFHPVLSASNVTLKLQTLGEYLKLNPQGR